MSWVVAFRRAVDSRVYVLNLPYGVNIFELILLRNMGPPGGIATALVKERAIEGEDDEEKIRNKAFLPLPVPFRSFLVGFCFFSFHVHFELSPDVNLSMLLFVPVIMRKH